MSATRPHSTARAAPRATWLRAHQPRLAPLVAAAASALLLTGCPDDGPPTTTDTCDNPEPAHITTLEIGHGADDPYNNDPQQFVPYADNDEAPIILGGQGLSMIVLRVRYTGQTGGCVGQKLSVTAYDGTEIAGFEQPLVVERDAMGRAVSHPIYLPSFYPKTFRVSSAAGGAQAMLALERKQDADCAPAAECEGRCQADVFECSPEQCEGVARSRRSAYLAIRDCQRAACGLPPAGGPDGGVPDGGAPDGGAAPDPTLPCAINPKSDGCGNCMAFALRQSDCAGSPACGRCVPQVTSCQSIAP